MRSAGAAGRVRLWWDAVVDVWTDAVGTLLNRWRRSQLTMLGLAFGVMTVTAASGISTSASAQISDRFNALQATTVTADSAALADPATRQRALAQARHLNGVVEVGVSSTSDGSDVPIRSTGLQDPAEGLTVSVLALSPGALSVMHAGSTSGRLFDEGHVRRGDRVVLLGTRVARDLGISRTDGTQQIRLGPARFAVIGIVTAPAQLSLDIPLSVVVPFSPTVRERSGQEFGGIRLVVRTRSGAARQVGTELPLVVSPQHPEDVAVQVPPDPRTLRREVENDTGGLVTAIALVTLLVSGLGVATTMYVSVVERRPEFGVRTAVGTSRSRIVSQIVVEGAVLGVVGGVLGTLLGIDVTFLVAFLQEWVTTLPATLYWTGPVLGGVVGSLAGTVPAVLAARASPIDAIRH